MVEELHEPGAVYDAANYKHTAIRIFFDGEVIGEYFADLVVDDLIIVEVNQVHLRHLRPMRVL